MEFNSTLFLHFGTYNFLPDFYCYTFQIDRNFLTNQTQIPKHLH